MTYLSKSIVFFSLCLGGCVSVRHLGMQEGGVTLSVTKQKQRIALLHKKLSHAEKHLQGAQDEVDALRSELYQAELAYIEKQVEAYEEQIKKSPEALFKIKGKTLFAKEREILQEMMEQGPSAESVEAQFVLDRILRVITALREAQEAL